ncbi:MAG: glycosyltransferase family 4 protein [bacterium]
MGRMRIAMIGTKGIPAKWGGIEKYIEEVGARLVERGHEVTVFGSRWFCRDHGGTTCNGILIKALPVIPLKATAALQNAFLASMLVALGDYDIANFHGYASYVFLPAIRRTGKVTVVTAHGVESGWMNPKYGSLERSVIRQAFKVGVTQADSVTTVADHLRMKLRKDFAVDAQVMPSGLDDVVACPAQIIQEKYRLDGLDYLLFLGRIDPIKRVDWLLDLPQVLPKEVKIVIAGGAQDPATKAYFQSLRQRSAACSQVIFTGPVSGREKAELLSNCLALLAPSQDEGLPITLLEALSYERFCIASRIPAHNEVIESGISGFLFPRDNKDAFMDIVKQVIQKPKESITAAGAQAKMHVAEKFNWARTAERLEALFENLSGNRNRPGDQ